MGCDIHAYIEYKRIHIDGHYYVSMISGSVSIDRDYGLFSALAGVRSESGFTPLIPPRGLPETVCDEAFNGFYDTVIDESEMKYFWGENYTTIQQSRRDGRQPIVLSRGFKRENELGYLPGPDWHHPSFLSLAEIYSALKHAERDLSTLGPYFRIVLEMMESTERILKTQARLVFWFDN